MGTFLQHKLTKKAAPKIFFISLKLNERKLSERINTHDDFVAISVKVIFFKNKCLVGTNIINLIYYHCHY